MCDFISLPGLEGRRRAALGRAESGGGGGAGDSAGTPPWCGGREEGRKGVPLRPAGRGPPPSPSYFLCQSETLQMGDRQAGGAACLPFQSSIDRPQSDLARPVLISPIGDDPTSSSVARGD